MRPSMRYSWSITRRTRYVRGTRFQVGLTLRECPSPNIDRVPRNSVLGREMGRMHPIYCQGKGKLSFLAPPFGVTLGMMINDKNVYLERTKGSQRVSISWHKVNAKH